MNIQITDRAERFLQQKMGEKSSPVRLVFDSEGCGCGVNGIPALWILPELDEYDMSIHSNGVPFVINRIHAVYFEENLYLDSEEGYPSFRLSGDSQLYGKNIRLLDKRED
ncbi:iron-sulfur cluster biosynthesis family protein [Paenibacillus sp. HJL G12]|uniref:Iron-sulfur cluster biosynthesis family protein n=1 Tax=Paenibacillus dendrobii TaxID=2691084 RepID=A0A7X3IF71_9BACL|nr:iron-sulfur cluster biosynthesis family protein [Paenibacillus dendrobii]MWV42211.1 iron-sulfur cluster biosynthesis family protein [Paenibacillus dendrobii]